MTNIKDATNAYSSVINQLKSPTIGAGDNSPGSAFGDLLRNSLQSAADAQHRSEKISGSALAGKTDMTEVLQAVTDAEVALNTVLAVRDKVVQAYEAVMRTPM